MFCYNIVAVVVIGVRLGSPVRYRLLLLLDCLPGWLHVRLAVYLLGCFDFGSWLRLLFHSVACVSQFNWIHFIVAFFIAAFFFSLTFFASFWGAGWYTTLGRTGFCKRVYVYVCVWRTQIRFFLAPARRYFLHTIVVILVGALLLALLLLLRASTSIQYDYDFFSIYSVVFFDYCPSVFAYTAPQDLILFVFFFFLFTTTLFSLVRRYVGACVCLCAWGGAPSPLSRMWYICMWLLL